MYFFHVIAHLSYRTSSFLVAGTESPISFLSPSTQNVYKRLCSVSSPTTHIPFIWKSRCHTLSAAVVRMQHDTPVHRKGARVRMPRFKYWRPSYYWRPAILLAPPAQPLSVAQR